MSHEQLSAQHTKLLLERQGSTSSVADPCDGRCCKVDAARATRPAAHNADWMDCSGRRRRLVRMRARRRAPRSGRRGRQRVLVWTWRDKQLRRLGNSTSAHGNRRLCGLRGLAERARSSMWDCSDWLGSGMREVRMSGSRQHGRVRPRSYRTAPPSETDSKVLSRALRRARRSLRVSSNSGKDKTIRSCGAGMGRH